VKKPSARDHAWARRKVRELLVRCIAARMAEQKLLERWLRQQRGERSDG